jgi:hypothetical protein
MNLFLLAKIKKGKGGFLLSVAYLVLNRATSGLPSSKVIVT